jgi:hypothetical protein
MGVDRERNPAARTAKGDMTKKVVQKKNIDIKQEEVKTSRLLVRNIVS